jgi:hypothetical protein
MDKIQKALNTLELGHLEGSVSKETIEKARSQSGTYANTSENKKLGRVGQKYKEGENKDDDSQKSEGKVKMAHEVMQAMEFLNIPKEKFSELKEKYGSLEKLHKEMSDRMSGKESKDNYKETDYLNNKNKLVNEVEELVKLKKKLYPNPDPESKMGKDEKELNEKISKIYSDINQLIIEQRKKNKI